jgi:Ca2+:H+ antiporter
MLPSRLALPAWTILRMAGKGRSATPQDRPPRLKAVRKGFANLSLNDLRAELPVLTGWVLVLVFFTVGKGWSTDFSNLAVTAAAFVVLFAAMIWCAFGVVRHAEVLAEDLGEPYGTLILTLAVISIEVTVMATVMLSGNPNPTLPRDTVYAVLMIVLNGMVGLAIVIGALRHRQQQYNLQGALAFLAVISSLAVLSLVLPTFAHSTADGSLTRLQAIVFGVLTALLYVAFLAAQTMRHRSFFVEQQGSAEGAAHAVRGPRHSLAVHAVLLIATLLPVVLLSKPLAHIIDYGIEEMGAPTALGGIAIALLVLAPEGLSALQAASRNQLQRAVNLSLGSALSTIGLTIPTMLALSLAFGIQLEIGLAPGEVVMLVLTLFIAKMTFSGAPTNFILGSVHLLVFAAFIVLVFSP